MRERRALATLVGAAVVAALVGGLFWATRTTGGGSANAPRVAANTATATMASRAASPIPNTAHTAPSASAEPPQPVPIDPSTAPPLDRPISKPAPAQQPFTREETIAKREADLKLLDDTKARLQNELTAATQAGNATAAHELEIRITRLTTLRKQRNAELDQIRAGGALPL
jgi:hypothetical protein